MANEVTQQKNGGGLSREARIYIAGHKGMVGGAVLSHLQELGFTKFITRTHAELDLTDQKAVRSFFQAEKVDHVVLAAAKVGGIYANNIYPAEFIYENIMIQANVMHEAFRAGVQHLLFLGSSCIYPKFAQQPMGEDQLLTGVLEPTNEPYAIAKIAGIKMCESYNRQYGTHYYSVMPTNLYGPGDNYNLENSHVIPAMTRKYHLAKLAYEEDLAAIHKDEAVYGPIPDDVKEAMGLSLDSTKIEKRPEQVTVLLWGTGRARREFLHVEDMAKACVHVMNLGRVDQKQQDYGTGASSLINIGCGYDSTIREVAKLISEVVGYPGQTVFDEEKPDGTMQKLLDIQKITDLGWKPRYDLKNGLRQAYASYCEALK